MTTSEWYAGVARRVVGVFIGALLIGPQTAGAQSCLGLPSLRETGGAVSVGANGTGPSRSLMARTQVAWGQTYVGVQTGVSGFKFASLRHMVYGGDMGRVFAVGGSGATTVCPVVQARFGFGRRAGVYETGTTNASIGLALGHTMRLRGSWSLTPFAQAAVERASGNSRPSAVTGQLSAGFGLRLNDRITLLPSYGRPVRYGSNVIGMDETYSLSVSFTPRGRAPR